MQGFGENEGSSYTKYIEVILDVRSRAFFYILLVGFLFARGTSFSQDWCNIKQSIRTFSVPLVLLRITYKMLETLVTCRRIQNVSTICTLDDMGIVSDLLVW